MTDLCVVVMECYDKLQAKYQLPLHLKKEQCDVFQLLLQKKDTFVVWPTGFGKSILFMATPLLFDEVSIVPLISAYIWLYTRFLFTAKCKISPVGKERN